MLNDRKPTWWMRCLSAVIVVAFVLCFMTDPISRAEQKAPPVGSGAETLTEPESSLPSEKTLQALMTRLNRDLKDGTETDDTMILSEEKEQLLTELHQRLKTAAMDGGQSLDPYREAAIEALMRRMRKIVAYAWESGEAAYTEETQAILHLLLDCRNIVPMIVLGVECADVLPTGRVAAVYENEEQLQYVKQWKEAMTSTGLEGKLRLPIEQELPTESAQEPVHVHQWGTATYPGMIRCSSLVAFDISMRTARFTCTVEGCSAIRTYETAIEAVACDRPIKESLEEPSGSAGNDRVHIEIDVHAQKQLDALKKRLENIAKAGVL